MKEGKTLDGLYISILLMRSKAWSLADGINFAHDYFECLGNLYPIFLAATYPSGQSFYVGVPNILHIFVIWSISLTPGKSGQFL